MHLLLGFGRRFVGPLDAGERQFQANAPITQIQGMPWDGNAG
jgi:hypothetical protein